jgi:ribosomal protein S27AE
MAAPTCPSSRAAFAVIAGGADADLRWAWFCGRCAAAPALGGELPSMRRVCSRCGFGILLRAQSSEVPAPGQPYLVVDASLAVQALSETAEDYLEISEQGALNRHITELLIPADRSVDGSADLAVALSLAARGVDSPSQAMVSRSNTFGERIRVRISPCGPPPAALVVLA